MRRAAGAKAAPADDRTLPYTEDDFPDDRRARESKDEIRRLLDGLGAREGA
jgi:hypothetical protein